jgi:hypothetical protein
MPVVIGCFSFIIVQFADWFNKKARNVLASRAWIIKSYGRACGEAVSVERVHVGALVFEDSV